MTDSFGPWNPRREAATRKLCPAQIHALARMGGNAPRVWFSGPDARAKERWLAQARKAWLADVAKWGERAAQGLPAAPGSMAKILAESINTEPQAKWGKLAGEFARIFGRDLKIALRMAQAATGYCGHKVSELAFGETFNTEIAPISKNARRTTALSTAQRAYDKARKAAWLPKPSLDAVELPRASTLSTKALDALGRALVDDFGFSELRVDGAMPVDQAARVLLGARRSFSWICEFTGLEQRLIGLGGWRLLIGADSELEAVHGASLGRPAAECNPITRTITLTREEGNFALPHEWFHAFDSTLPRWTGLHSTYASESSLGDEKGRSLGAQVAAASRALRLALVSDENRWSNLPERKAVPVRDLVSDFFFAAAGLPDTSSSTSREAVGTLSRWLAGALQPASGPADYFAQRKVLAQFAKRCKKAEPTATASPASLAKAHDRTLVALHCEGSVKRQLAACARRPSLFASHAVLDDVLRKNLSGMDRYFTRNPEILARAFEACLQAHACDALGIELAPVEMLTDILHTEVSAPRGRELACAQAAFKVYFATVRSMAPQAITN